MSAKLAFNEFPIEGSDTATMLASRLIMKDGTETQNRTSSLRVPASSTSSLFVIGIALINANNDGAGLSAPKDGFGRSRDLYKRLRGAACRYWPCVRAPGDRQGSGRPRRERPSGDRGTSTRSAASPFPSRVSEHRRDRRHPVSR